MVCVIFIEWNKRFEFLIFFQDSFFKSNQIISIFFKILIFVIFDF
jgi:hypothetical protein